MSVEKTDVGLVLICVSFERKTGEYARFLCVPMRILSKTVRTNTQS